MEGVRTRVEGKEGARGKRERGEREAEGKEERGRGGGRGERTLFVHLDSLPLSYPTDSSFSQKKLEKWATSSAPSSSSSWPRASRRAPAASTTIWRKKLTTSSLSHLPGESRRRSARRTCSRPHLCTVEGGKARRVESSVASEGVRVAGRGCLQARGRGSVGWTRRDERRRK